MFIWLVYVYLILDCEAVGQNNVFLCAASHCGWLRMSNDINTIQLTCFSK